MMLESYTGVYGKVSAQWTDANKEVLSKTFESINNHFARMLSYSVNVTDESFASYTASIYHQKYSGYFKRNRESFHSYLGSVHTIQNKDCRIAVDSEKRMIMISDPVDYLTQVMPVESYTALLKICTKVLESHSENGTTYRLEFNSKNPVAAYEITIKDSLPEKIVVYYAKSIKAPNENAPDKPKLEVYFSNWVINTTQSKEDFDLEKYIEKKGNNYVLKPPYSVKYKLLDERVLTRNEKK
jgi:hypothetical protein